MYKKAFTIYILVTILSFAYAQDISNFAVTRLSQDDGLSQGSNYFRFEDSKGFMWITCNDALNRFDGKKVKVYNLDKYFSNCPNLQQGYGFCEDKNSNIYIGSVRGLYIYDREQDRFTLQKIFKNSIDDIAMPIAYIDNKVWCFNRQYQLATYDIKTKKISYKGKLKTKPIISIHIYELQENIFYNHYPFMDKRKNIWFIGDNEIIELNTRTLKYSYPLRDNKIKKKESYYASSYDISEDCLYLGLQNGILKYNLKSRKKSYISNVLGKILHIKANTNAIVFKDNFNLKMLNKKTKKIIVFPNIKNDDFILSYCFGFDKDNRLWMCDDGKGQKILDFTPKLLNKFPNESSKFNFLLNKSVGRFGEIDNKKIIIPLTGSDYNIMLVFDKNTNEKKIINSDLNKNSVGFDFASDYKRKGIWVFNIYKKNNSKIYELYFLNQKMETSKKIQIQNLKEFGQEQDFQVLKNGKILCTFSKGLFWFIPEEKRFEQIKLTKQINFFKINVLDQNQIAFSFLNNDMLLFDLLPDGTFKLKTKILPGIQTFYIQKDVLHKRYWVGTNQGVYLLDQNFKIIKIFNANNGLAGTYIYGLLLDDKGSAYCSHQRGISSINWQSFQVINFDKNDGIQNWDFNNRSFYKASDGTLFFGGISGLNYFNPPLYRKSNYKPEVYIDEILINNKLLVSKTHNVNTLTTLNLNYDENNISIFAYVKDLAAASTRQLIFRIKENGKKWNYLTNGSAINFSNLAPNIYTLELGTYDKFTNQELVQKTLRITISAPFYHAVSFWILIASILIGAVFWWYNQKKLEKQKIHFKQQLALEMQRSKITADLHDDIGATLSSLQINSAVANQLIVHDPIEAKKVLHKIENQSKNLADKIGDIIWSMKPNNEEFMTISTRIRNFANDILGATDIEYALAIDNELNELITDITNRKNIVLFVKEAINNAAKYSQASQIKISLHIIEHKIEIQIIDNGIGFNVDEIRGNGISNMKKRILELKGEIQIISSHLKGTTILATLPIPTFRD